MESSLKTIVEKDALEKLPDILQAYPGVILLIADTITYKIAGAKVAAILRRHGLAYQECILHRKNPLVPDEHALAEIQTMLHSEITLVLAVGSGTITDLARYSSFNAGIPFIAVATAPSMDGYASPVAPLTLKGFKQTLPAAPPRAIVADVTILATAPAHMVQAGLGDILGKYTALADWKLGQIIEGENHSPEIEAMVRTAVDQAVEGFSAESDPSLRLQKLTEALIISGEAMLKWGNSRPASGAEHHLAHYWEMQAALQGTECHFHGIKVGIATVLVTYYYHRLFQLTPADITQHLMGYHSESDEDYERRIQTAYGSLAPEVLADLKGYYRDLKRRAQRQTRILANWSVLQTWVQHHLPISAQIVSLLQTAGAPVDPEHLGLTESDLALALQSAKEVRQRYTVFRLAEDLNWP